MIKTILQLVITLPLVLFSQIDTTRALSFYPLHIGDEWHWRSGGIHSITGDTLIEGRHYYLKHGTQAVRIDRLELNVYEWNPYIEIDEIILDLSATEPGAEFGDRWFFLDESESWVFDTLRSVRTYENSWAPLYDAEYQYASGIGLIRTHETRHNADDTVYRLSGAIIDGVVFGTLVGTLPEEVVKPEKMNIHIYPNPTNMDGVITFSTPGAGKYQIAVYALDGSIAGHARVYSNQRGIQQFYLNSIEWTQALDSGIYIINVKGDSFRQTTRFAFIK